MKVVKTAAKAPVVLGAIVPGVMVLAVTAVSFATYLA
jgi:hypothetical protein